MRRGWRDTLTKEEQEHLRATGAKTKAAFIRNREAQRSWGEDRAKLGLVREVCWECRFIAQKLGLED